MKKILLVIMISLTASVYAKGTGIGIILFGPTGISFEHYLSGRSSLDGALAFNLSGNTSFYAHITHLWKKRNGIRLDGTYLGWYWGVGGRLISRDNDNNSDSDFHLGPRVPIGIYYRFREPPIELFGEASLSLDIIPSTDADIGIGIGARYYF